MNPRTAWIVYVVVRLALFAAPFALLMLFGWPWWLAAIVATLASVSLSIIFLSKPRETASESVYAWRHRTRTVDDIVEDSAVDAALQDPAAAAPTGPASDPELAPTTATSTEVPPAKAAEQSPPAAPGSPGEATLDR